MAEDKGRGASVGQAASQTVGNVASAASQATAAAGQAAQQAKDAAAPITDQVQETAGQVTEQAKQQALTQLGTQKEHAAGSLDAVAQALRQSGDQLRTKQQEPLADLAGTAAERVERLSGYLRHTDVKEMVRDVEGFARRQPAAFLGGAFTLGVLAARFLKSSARPDDDQGTGAPGRTPSYRGYGSNAYATSGTSRYPGPGRYPPLGHNASGTAASGALAPARATGGDPGSVDAAMPDPTLRATPTGATTARSVGGPTGPGWGSTPRSMSVRTEGRDADATAH